MKNSKDISNPAYKNLAFISYAHEPEDEKFASWLQRKIETFWLPKRLRKKLNNFPKKLYPIFRDKTDLLPKMLDEAIQENLASSEYLIVICSPHSAEKNCYVQCEVEEFARVRSTKNIITVNINGEVQSDDSKTECFCTALLEMLKKKEIPAVIDARPTKIKKKRKTKSDYDALYKIIALLTGNDVSDFPIRVNKWDKEKKQIRASILSIFALCLFVAGFMAWNYYIPQTNYYSDYITEWGAPKGIGKLTENQIANMYAHYEITTERGLVRKLEYADSTGNPAAYLNDEWEDRPRLAYYYYRDGGVMNYVEILDSSGNLIFSQVYSTDLQFIDFQVAKNNSSASTLVRQFTGTGDKILDPVADSSHNFNSDITRYCLTYNSKGQIIQVMFQRDNRGTTSTDAYGISGIRYELDEEGKIVTRWFLNRNGEIMYDGVGIAGQRYIYSDYSMPAQVINIGTEGENKNSRQGWSIKTRDFDINGNITFVQFLDRNGERTYYSSGGDVFSGIAKTYNSEGFLTSDKYYDADNNPLNCSDGYSMVSYTCNEKGYRIASSYFDQDNNPVLNKSDYHLIQQITRDDGLKITETYFDSTGKPVNLSGGVGQYITTYDTSGNLLTKEYFDKNGVPVLNSEGIHKHVFLYDDLNQVISISFYGMLDEPILLPSQMFAGIHEARFQYDENRNVSTLEFYGCDEEPVVCADGYFRISTVFSNSGNILEETHWNIDGSAVSSVNSGYHKKTFKYDDYGNPIEIAIYNNEDKPIAIPGCDVWKIVSLYDEFGFVKSTSNYGIDGNPAYTPSKYGGWFRSECSRDEKGNIIEERYFDVDGQPCNCNAGYAIRRDSLNEEGTELIRHSYYDANENPVLSINGYSSVDYEYDTYGNTTKKSCYGTDGNLIISSDDFAICVMAYDYKGRMISMEFYDTEEKPMLTDDSYFRVAWNYLPDGGKEIFTYLTESAYKDGRYGSYFLYDSSDNLVEQKSINADGTPLEE